MNMSVKLAVVMDPIRDISAKKDTTLAILLPLKTVAGVFHILSKPAYTLMTESQWLKAAHSELPMICKTGFP